MVNKAISYAMKLHSLSRSRVPVQCIESLLGLIINAPDDSVRKLIWRRYRDEIIDKSLSLPIANKFKRNPETFFESMAIVLRNYSTLDKGILLLKYSYAFPLFLSLFDVNRVMERYHIVLEPSWIGYCEGTILCFADLPCPVFVQTLEPKDAALLQNITGNLVPVEIGANWWVDHRVFRPHPELSKDSDICVVASWAKFKNHDEIFDAVAEIRRKGRVLRMVLVGYPIDLTKDAIFRMAKDRGIGNQVELYEKIPPEEVAAHISRCKANVVWSKKEGVNKAIIEGFLCDVPGILRKGFNYGYNYEYINGETGTFASRKEIKKKLLYVCDHYQRYRPRDWVLNKMTCFHAARALKEAIDPRYRNECGEFRTKVNFLDGMQYFDSESRSCFDRDYDYLLRCMN